MKRLWDELSAGAADRLPGHGSPGNVREPANAMERAVAVAKPSRIGVEEPAAPGASGPVPGARRHRGEIEKDYICDTVESNGGNRRGAAPELGIGLATPHRKIKSYKARAGGAVPPPKDPAE